MERNRWWLDSEIFIVNMEDYVFPGRGESLTGLWSYAELRVRLKAHEAVYNHILATILGDYASAISALYEDFLPVPRASCYYPSGIYVGVAKDLNAMVTAFRVGDYFYLCLQHTKLDSRSPPEIARHKLPWHACMTIRPGILDAIIRADDLYGDNNVMVTGHSTGGAMASFSGLDLVVNHEARNVQVLTFGQPRIGNAAFVSYYSDRVPNSIRITSGHDIVPHLPPYNSRFPQKTYHHFPREVWLYNIGFGSLVYQVERVCDSSGEDPSCSRSVTGNSIADHVVYYGVGLMAETWRSCKIVTDPRLKEYGGEDVNGNLMLSRNPSAAALRLPSDSDANSNFS
ncbi:uncharacterized protein LOC115753678 [Rhodamnia argentea]|uniref:Uncharacterized protein LOC115753678 n=1 Tax=Rhodamnia argentea TaxID=178133 RepID=A0ABM3HBB7_9MYRT|nr:uncharacterized protein LOC115753678 [Rhodamnia argentea]